MCYFRNYDYFYFVNTIWVLSKLRIFIFCKPDQKKPSRDSWLEGVTDASCADAIYRQYKNLQFLWRRAKFSVVHSGGEEFTKEQTLSNSPRSKKSTTVSLLTLIVLRTTCIPSLFWHPSFHESISLYRNYSQVSYEIHTVESTHWRIPLPSPSISSTQTLF